MIEGVFKSEVDAYHIAQTNSTLQEYCPEFYGIVNIEKIIDQQGNDISEKFYLDLAYEMEFIIGHFGPHRDQFNCPISKRFQEAGINYMEDCSIVYDEKGNVKKFIDFATTKPST